MTHYTQEWFDKHQQKHARRVQQSETASSRAKTTGAQGVASGDKPKKMRNIETTSVDGAVFPSKKEAHHWQELNLLAKGGKITELRRQYPVGVTINGEHVCTLIVDFRFKDKQGIYRYQDAKGRKAGVQYQMFKLKAKLLMATQQILVEEV